jgi:uncharacterized protein DUF6894
MPEYFFHIDGPTCLRDCTGAMLPDDGVAWTEARRCVRELAAICKPGESWHLEVATEDRPVFVLTVSSRKL